MITVGVDNFERCIPELKVLFPKHWDELALFKDRMPLAVQCSEYVRRERLGVLVMTTVRIDGMIQAYYIVQITPGLHYGSTLTANTDIYYVTPDKRGQGLVLPLFRSMERELIRRGVQIWYTGYKPHNPMLMQGVLTALGFTPSDAYMAKWIGQ